MVTNICLPWQEREWIEKLREAQTVQEMAFEQLETALVKDGGVVGGSGGGAAGPLSAGSSMSSMHGPPRYEEASPAASPPRSRPGPHSPPTLDDRDRDRDRQTAARRGSGSGSVGKLPLPAGKKKSTGPRK